MKLDLTPTLREQAGLDAQRAAYNAGQSPENQLDEAAFVTAFTVAPFLAQLADQYDPATTGDIAILRAAVKADPTGAKDAIEAKEAAIAAEIAAKLEAAQPVEEINP